MKLLMISIITLISLHLQADDCCICQTGTEPQSQVVFFQAGCGLWLNGQQGCSSKETIPFADDLDARIPRSCDRQTVRLGYVGHWSGSYESMDFIYSRLLPINQGRGISFDVRNTACLSVDDPFGLQSFLNDIEVITGTTITWRGNQAISTGMWAPITPERENIPAVASTDESLFSLPACNMFERSLCSGFQRNQEARCASDDGSTRILSCCNYTRSVLMGGVREPVVRLLWLTTASCD